MLPQVLFRTGVSLAISSRFLFKAKKYFINKKDPGFGKSRVLLRHYFISLSKGVDFLEAKPTCFFLSLLHLSHSFGGGSKYLGSFFSLPKCCLDHHQAQVHWLEFTDTVSSYLDLLSFVAVICNENQKHLWCYLLLPSCLWKSHN